MHTLSSTWFGAGTPARFVLFCVCLVLPAGGTLTSRAAGGERGAVSDIRARLAVGALRPAFSPGSVRSEADVVWFGNIGWQPADVTEQKASAVSESSFVGVTAGSPMIAITNVPRTAPGSALTNGVTLRGTHAETAGNLWVLNRENYAVQEFPPAGNGEWGVTATNLVEGRNRIGVYGEAADGSRASDGVWIWVGERYTSVPAVTILSPDFIALSNAVTAVSLHGTHNEHVRGTIQWYNAKTWATGVVVTGVVDQGDWTVAVSNLDVGRNPIYVIASNRYGDVTRDLAIVTRAERADAARVVITNAPAYIVSDGPETPTISGVHSNLQGAMWWSISERGTGGFFTPGADGRWMTVVPVEVGTNTIVVSGRDSTGEVDRDEAVVRVGPAPFADEPAIDILNTNPTVVTFAETSLNITAVTDYAWVDSVVWTNPVTGASATLDSDGNGGWFGTVLNLAVGYNDVYVIMTTSYGDRATDFLGVLREDRGEAPEVVVTNAPDTVTYETGAVTLSGTNNVYVSGAIVWSNVATGVEGGATRLNRYEWEATVSPLAVGDNPIVLIASNGWGDTTHDAVSVWRAVPPQRPALAITNPVPRDVDYGTQAVWLRGTNNAAVAFPPICVNVSRLVTATVAWASDTWACKVDLQVGQNLVYVLASSDTGQTASDARSVYRAASPEASAVGITTNDLPREVPFGTDFLDLSGTNNNAVVGALRWVNAYSSVTTVFDRAGTTWSCRIEPLAEGMNVLYVLATNAYDEVAVDTFSIERKPPPPPVVDITNRPPASVGHQITSLILSGTNNPLVVGSMEWLNPPAAVGRDFPAPPGGTWSIQVSNLVYGLNEIFVTGADAAGHVAYDGVAIFREFPPMTRYVRPGAAAVYPYTNWPSAAATIQDAIDAASDGDIVLVDEGTYAAGRSLLSGEQTMSRVVIAGPVRVRGVGDPAATIIQGAWDGDLNAVRCAHVGEGGELIGMTLKNGHAEPFLSPEGGNGGGARVTGGALVNCLVTDSFAGNAGGGVHAAEGGELENNRITGNVADGAGGGLFLDDAAATGCDVEVNAGGAGGGGVAMRGGTMSACRIRGNETVLGPGGGVLVLKSSSNVLRNCVLADNQAAGHGGAAAVMGTSSVAYCTIAYNKAAEASGGVACSGVGALSRSILFGNTLLGGGNDPQFAGNDLTIADSLLPFPWPDNMEGVPEFAGQGDYHLMAGSPGIDAIGPAMDKQTSPGDEDLDGLPRPLDGDADGVAGYDPGAYEYLYPAADSDHDGLRDGWENEFGLNLVSGIGDDGGAGDPDGDGFDNIGEQGADTDPGDPGSLLRIVNVEHIGGDVHVTVQGGADATRTLVSRDGIVTGGVWSGNATSPAPTAITNVLIHTDVTVPARFYRVRARRP